MTNNRPREFHGMAGTPEYQAWQNMLARCLNPNNPRYEYYGGRGITVCEQWISSFIAFFDCLGPRPSQEHSLDRTNENGNYEPDNCVWALLPDQLEHRRPYRWRKLSDRPNRYIRKDGNHWEVRVPAMNTFIGGYYESLEAAENARADIEFEREVHRALGARGDIRNI